MIIALIDGLDSSQAQQLRESLGDFVIGLVPVLDQLVVTRIADSHRCDQRFKQFIEPGGVLSYYVENSDPNRCHDPACGDRKKTGATVERLSCQEDRNGFE